MNKDKQSLCKGFPIIMASIKKPNAFADIKIIDEMLMEKSDPVPPVDAIIPLTTAKIIKPSTSSITAAPKMIFDSV